MKTNIKNFREESRKDCIIVIFTTILAYCLALAAPLQTLYAGLPQDNSGGTLDTAISAKSARYVSDELERPSADPCTLSYVVCN